MKLLNVKILLIEDNIDHQAMIQDALLSLGTKGIDITIESTLTNGITAINSGYFDVCLCDLALPDSVITHTIEWLSAHDHSIPTIVLTSFSSEEAASDLLNAGIQDFISKDNLIPELLLKTLKYSIERWKQQQLIREQNQDMQAFCSSLSHDFNGHISRIIGVSDMIKHNVCETTEVGPKLQELFEFLDISTKGVQRLVNDLQQYLSLNNADREFKSISLSDVVELARLTVKMTSSKPFDLILPEKLPNVRGSASLLQILFQNLIGNSVKFSEGDAEIKLVVTEDDDFVHLGVQDNGIGFEQEHISTIFVPFKRLQTNTKYKGTGLGLSIVKRIADIHRAGIRVESQPNEGTTFTVSFRKRHYAG